MGERYKRTIHFILKTYMAIVCIFPLGYFLLEYIDLHTHAPWFGETSGWDTCYTVLSPIFVVMGVIAYIEYFILSIYFARYLTTKLTKSRKPPILWEVMALYLGLSIFLLNDIDIDESIGMGIVYLFFLIFGILSLFVFGVIILLNDDGTPTEPDSTLIFSNMADNPRRALSTLLKMFPIAVILWFLEYFVCERVNYKFGYIIDMDISVKIYQVLVFIVFAEFMLILSYVGNCLATRYRKTPIFLELIFLVLGACILFIITKEAYPEEILLACLIFEVCAVIIFVILSLKNKNKNTDKINDVLIKDKDESKKQNP